MTLVRFDDLTLEFGDDPLLMQAEFAIEPGERVCLIGRNGAGKTSLLKLITGQLRPDHGEIQWRNGVRISELRQDLPESADITVREAVTAGLADVAALRHDYEARSMTALDASGLREIEALHQQIDSLDGWSIEQRVETIITEMNLPADSSMAALSGGWRRRVGLARALVSQPDLLLLDEPTNHLDIATIEWLEDRVRGFSGSVMFITHDRAFLQKLATRIVEIDRGRLLSWPGDYRSFLIKKEKALQEEAVENARFDKKLAQEEIWIRQGIKARRTRNEGRARALQAMREERAKRRSQTGTANLQIDEADKSGRKVLRAYNITHGFGGEKLIENFSCTIARGDRLGLIGNNGVGKTTLLRILLGEIEPQQGTVKLGTNLEIGYFDQLRHALDPERSVAENVGDGREFVNINGKDKHIISYLSGFLFSAKRARTPVKALSGGERNRIILAKLFTRSTNLLVLDEPTNDLDVETLEVLEERLAQYTGTLIVVSHDREFLDNVVTSVLVFETGHRIVEYVGGYSDWLRRNRQLARVDDPVRNKAQNDKKTGTTRRTRRAAKKLSYKLQRELDALPAEIAAEEKRLASLQAQVANDGFYGQPFEVTQPVLDQLEETSSKLDHLTERWLELEEQSSAG